MSAAVRRMPHDLVDCDVDALQAELEEKDKALLLAGQYGRKLLEERDNLKCELGALKEDNGLLKKRLELQQQDALKILQDCKSDARIQIAQLEDELERTHINMDSEKTAGLTSHDDLQQSLEQLSMENEQLRKELSQMLQHHKDELEVAKAKLEVREKGNGLMKSEVVSTKKILEKMEEEKQELERCLMLKQHSCEQLAAELQLTKQEAEAWEYQCICNEQLLKSQDNELDDTRDRLTQLQQEVSLKECLQSPSCSTPKITRATSSLFDELSDEVTKPMTPRSMPSSTASSTTATTGTQEQTECSDAIESARHTCVSTSERLLNDTSAASLCADAPSSWGSKAEVCLKCVELQGCTLKQQEEIEVIKKQLLAVIQQKIKLHEQIEAWQSDVEEMLGSRVQQQQLDNLTHDKKKSKSKHRGLLRGSEVGDSTKLKKLPLKTSWTS